MSAADKYGRQAELPAAAMKQVQEAGQALHSQGVKHDAGASESPAVKYGTPNANARARSPMHERSL